MVEVIDGSTDILHDMGSVEHPTARKIASFSSLPAGWHFGEGDSFASEVINQALQFHMAAQLLGFFTTDAFPGIEGEVIVSIYEGDDCLDFVFQPDGKVEYSREQYDEEIENREELEFEEAQQILIEFGKEKWRQSGYYISNITTGINVVLYPEPFRNMAGEFPLLISNASPPLNKLFVITSENTTLQ